MLNTASQLQAPPQMPTLTVSPWEMLKGLSWLKRFKLFFHGGRFLLKPERTDELFKIIHLFLDNEFKGKSGLRDYIRSIYEIPGVRAMYEERYLPAPANLDELIKLPPGSLGHEYAVHMRRNNLDVVFYPVVDVVDEFTYISMRGRQMHDILHVVTGFSTSVPDELGLQAFEIAQINDPLSGAIIGGGLMHAALKKPDIIYEALLKIIRGFEIGRASRNILTYKFEDNFATPLAEVRATLGL